MIKLVRKEGDGGNCAICKQPVELQTGRELWTLKCACRIAVVPQWVLIDSYSRIVYRRHFEWREVAEETEG